jgi:hypothetical protein
VLRESDRGLYVDVREAVERTPSVGMLARVYGWGPKSGDWDALGRWQVRWLSPFAGWQDAHVSLPAPPPQIVLDQTRFGSSGIYGMPGQDKSYRFAAGDDPAHALLVGARQSRETVVFEVEADRVPVEVHRADGEPFTDVEGVVRAAGRWFLAAPASVVSTSPVTVVWQIDGAVARELVRIPRAFPENSYLHDAHAKLARRSDGRAIGLVVEGQPAAERNASVRWVLPIDLESGALGEPESLGYVDLAGRTLEGCTDDVVGWVLDAPLSSPSVRIHIGAASGGLSGPEARFRLTSERACIERVAGTYDGQSAERAAQLARSGAVRTALRSGELLVTAMSAQTRYALRCTTVR